MCDYSMMDLPNRLAAEGDELAAHRFQSGSLGFVSCADAAEWHEGGPKGFWQWLKSIVEARKDPTPVVCIPPGARLRLYDIPASLRSQYGVKQEESVLFTQVSATAGAYRDAIAFRNGRTLLLQQFEPGQRLRVLWLDESAEEREPEARLSRAIA